MRIFGFGNWAAVQADKVIALFLSAMRIFGFGNTPVQTLVAQIASFYPQCGFLALGTRKMEYWSPAGATVSIRNADFWLWELVCAKSFGYPKSFLSAMRIFGFGNIEGHRSSHPRRIPVSIRNADFWLWELSHDQKSISIAIVSIRNADFWLWEHLCNK